MSGDPRLQALIDGVLGSWPSADILEAIDARDPLRQNANIEAVARMVEGADLTSGDLHELAKKIEAAAWQALADESQAPNQ